MSTTQQAIDAEADALSAPGGAPGYRRPEPTSRPREAVGEQDALSLPGVAEPTRARGPQRTADRPSARAESAPTPAAQPVAPAPAERTAATPERPAPGAAHATAPATGDGKALIVIEGGQIKYADPSVFVANLDTIASVNDPDALYATLKDLRAVQSSDARGHLVDRVQNRLRETLAL